MHLLVFHRRHPAYIVHLQDLLLLVVSHLCPPAYLVHLHLLLFRRLPPAAHVSVHLLCIDVFFAALKFIQLRNNISSAELALVAPGADGA